MYWKIIKISDISNEAFDAAYAALTPSRKEHIDRMKIADDRRRSLAGEILARELIKEHFGMSAPKIERAESGMPLTDCGVYISIAHSGDYAVCAAAREPIGIDIECRNSMKERLAERVCTEKERRYVYGSGDFSSERMCEVWALKEACFKKIGTGITDFKSVDTLSLSRIVKRHDNFIIAIVQ